MSDSKTKLPRHELTNETSIAAYFVIMKEMGSWWLSMCVCWLGVALCTLPACRVTQYTVSETVEACFAFHQEKSRTIVYRGHCVCPLADTRPDRESC